MSEQNIQEFEEVDIWERIIWLAIIVTIIILCVKGGSNGK
jgi:hypothetical protein